MTWQASTPLTPGQRFTLDGIEYVVRSCNLDTELAVRSIEDEFRGLMRTIHMMLPESDSKAAALACLEAGMEHAVVAARVGLA